MPYDQKSMRLAISEARVPHCEETGCDGLVKPDIVFFGEAVSHITHKPRQAPSLISIYP